MVNKTITKTQYTILAILFIILALILTLGVGLSAREILNGSYATIIKILTATICFIWGGSVIIAGYFVWRIKRDIC
jgi:hypothetical protein